RMTIRASWCLRRRLRRGSESVCGRNALRGWMVTSGGSGFGAMSDADDQCTCSDESCATHEHGSVPQYEQRLDSGGPGLWRTAEGDHLLADLDAEHESDLRIGGAARRDDEGVVLPDVHIFLEFEARATPRVRRDAFDRPVLDVAVGAFDVEIPVAMRVHV